MDPKSRFSSRVANYVRYRPSYPTGAIDLLEIRCGLKPGSVVADVGSGTGILSRLLLDRGARVYGVEPNDEMRMAAEAELASRSEIHSVASTAEHTTLPTQSVDLVTAGQAFHWFDRKEFRTECIRILKPMGFVALLWNDRLTDASAFLRDYEDVLQEFSLDYRQVDHKNVGHDVIEAFFKPSNFQLAEFANSQVMDWDGFFGRVMSSSYVPMPDHPRCEEMVKELRRVFEQHKQSGTIELVYRTQVFFGQLEQD